MKAVGIEPEIDEKGVEFIKTHLKYIIHFVTGENMIFGHPSQLNKDNDCYFYLPKKQQKPRGIINAIKDIFGKKEAV